MNEEGVSRGALLLMSLGEDCAVEVFKFLGPKEVQKLGFAMANMNNVKREEMDKVLGDFIASTQNRANLRPGQRWVFDHPFFLLLNVAVGGDWPGNPDASTVFPQTMLVDYVRVYGRPGE